MVDSTGLGPPHTLLVGTTYLPIEELTIRCDNSVTVAMKIFRDLMDREVLLRVLLESEMAFKGKVKVDTRTSWDDCVGLGSF